MKTIEDWRKSAEFYFCKCCLEQYKRYFEPEIRHLLLNPIDDWKEVEIYITQMYMITEGVFKGNNKDNVDWKEYDKKEHRYFTDKIKHLKQENILQESSVELLTEANKVRNKIHNSHYSMQDLILFYHAHVVTSRIWDALGWAQMSNAQGNEFSVNLKSEAEKLAKEYLEKYKFNHRLP